MTDRDHPQEDEGRPRRPRVVDKRISARSEAPEPAAPETGGPGDGPSRAAGAEAGRPSPQGKAPAAEEPSAPAPGAGGDPYAAGDVWTPEQQEAARRLAQQILATPAENWVLNVAMTLIDVAGVKLDGGDVAGSQLAIDTLSALVNGVGARLGDAEASLRRALADLQMAYAQRVAGPPEGPRTNG